MRTQESITKVAEQLSELLTQCLQTAFEQVQQKDAGEDWFDRLLDEEKTNIRPILSDQKSVSDCGLQELLKLLRYRTRQTEELLGKFGFDITETQMSSYVRRKQLFLLLDRLIARTPGQSLYSDEEAAHDMLKLSKLFTTVEDGEGNTFNDRMTQIFRQYTLSKAKIAYPVKEAIRAETIKGCSVRSFLSACRKLRIETAADNDTPCFLSNDYQGDIETVREYCKMHRKKCVVSGCIAGLGAALLITGAVFCGRKLLRYARAHVNEAGAQAVQKYLEEQKPELERLVEKILSVPPEEAGQYIVDPDYIYAWDYDDSSENVVELTLAQSLHNEHSRHGGYDFVPVPELSQQDREGGILFFYDDDAGAFDGDLSIEVVLAQQTESGFKINAEESDNILSPSNLDILNMLMHKYGRTHVFEGRIFGETTAEPYVGRVAAYLNNGTDNERKFNISGEVVYKINPLNSAALEELNEYFARDIMAEEEEFSGEALGSHLEKHSLDGVEYYSLTVCYAPTKINVPAHTALSTILTPATVSSLTLEDVSSWQVEYVKDDLNCQLIP